MLVNLSSYIKESFFKKDIESLLTKEKLKYCIVSDVDIVCKWNFYKIDTQEPIWQILALSEKYGFVFVVLDRLNYDNIYRLYKNNPTNVCILNLNIWYTWIWIKTISPDLDDIYIKQNVQVLEPMDLNNFKFNISNFLDNNVLTHIRISNKDMEENIWQKDVSFDYKWIINFNEFWFSWFSGTILVYWSMLQEWINVAWLLQWEWIWLDMFWIWNYKTPFSIDLINSLDNQDKIFIIWDFSDIVFRDFIYSQFYLAWLNKEEIYFCTPQNTTKQVVKDFVSESVEMEPIKIYEKIRKHIE